jgi:transcriptional regulator with GAF, ATPase, and Fis domain
MLLEALKAVVSRAAEPARVLQTILHQAVEQTGADRGLFVEVGRSGQLAYRVLYRFKREHLTGEAGRYSESIFEQVLQTGRAVRLENALDDPEFQNRVSVQAYRLVSVLCMPIEVDGEIAALVHLESNESGRFEEHHEELLRSLLGIAGPALGALQASQGVLLERDALRDSESRARLEIEENRQLLSQDWSFGRFIGRSAPVRELAETLGKAAETDFPVLLLGETGTGKNILARVLHHASPRSKQALVTLFCPSLEKGTVETELFGHRRGAFTGAVTDRIGKVQAAENGSLFLDEIADLPLDLQPKLLRLLQEKTFERVGDPTEREADIRVIVATNRDLEEEVEQGRFRRDLYERLNFVPIRVPPLRERKEDIPLLLRHCLDRQEAGRWIELSEAANRFLVELDFTWPGNVRHLEHLAARLAMERLTAHATPGDLRRLLDSSARGEGRREAGDLEAGLPALLGQAERSWLLEATRRYPTLSRAALARKLKIAESTLYKKLRLYDIDV